jgi:pimeloyl-ACP methyl ester carboxylesterase
MLDPRFVTAGLDVGYLTTQPDTRGSTFYYLSNVDSAVLAADEATKETVTEAELGELEVFGNQAVSLLIDVPVLSVVGRWDALFCMAVPCADALNAATLEPLAYSPAAELELVVVPESGHNLNLQQNAPQAFDTILAWLDDRFPPPPSE